ncbi:hypothetical protein F503_03931 [Ophiostoma piceae UAMH 11346]|uniref:Uncharacterized protein n=1 Tax=Ophiostoma piceae (strain UAMH 11346) TaxID=1262450 RepID=S3BSH9_OPHP1|nr:hypothetical protein F503_03931 [Ophiostoma piceae UAMH 11346]
MCRIIVSDTRHILCGHIEKEDFEVALCHRLGTMSDYDPELCPGLHKVSRSLDSWRIGLCNDCRNDSTASSLGLIDYDYCPKRVHRRKHTLCGHTQLVYNKFRDCVHTLILENDAGPQALPQYRKACPLDIEVVDFNDTTMLCLQCKTDCATIGFELEHPAQITNIDDEMKYLSESTATGIPEVHADPESTTIFFAPGFVGPDERPVQGSPRSESDDDDSSSDGGSGMFDHDDDVQRVPDDDEEVLETRLSMALLLHLTSNNIFQVNGIYGNLQYDQDPAILQFDQDAVTEDETGNGIDYLTPDSSEDGENYIDTPDSSADGENDTDDENDIDTPESSEIGDDDAVFQPNTHVQPVQQPDPQTGQDWMDIQQSQISQLEEQDIRLAESAIICDTRVKFYGDYVLGDWVRDIIINGRMGEEFIFASLEHVTSLDFPVTIESIEIALDSLRDAVNTADQEIQQHLEINPENAPGFTFTQRSTYLDRIEEVKAILPDEVIIIENYWDKSETDRKAEYAEKKQAADDRKKEDKEKKKEEQTATK